MAVNIFIPINQYQAYANCIRDGEIDHEHMMAIFKVDPLFKIWYQHKYHKQGLLFYGDKYLNEYVEKSTNKS